MPIQLQTLDNVKLNSRLYTNFACDYSEDGKIFILTDTGIYALTLKGYADSVFNRFTFKKDLIKLTDISIGDYLDVDLAGFMNNLSRDHFYEAVLDVSLSGNDLNAKQLDSKPVFGEWSPRGVVEKTGGVLAVLTNLSNIEVYVETLDENELSEWICVVNFAKEITDQCKRTWNKIDTFADDDEKFAELKERIHYIAPTTFTWSHVVLRDKKACCVLFVGHRDGSISAWRFVERKINNVADSKLEFLSRYSTNLKTITALHWYCRKSDAGGLTIGDVEGKICAVSVRKLSTDDVIFSDEVVLNNDVDLKVDKITAISHLNITYLIVVKQNYLSVIAIDNSGEVVEGKLIQTGTLYITGIVHYEKNSVLVLTLSGLLKQIEFSIKNNELIFTETVISLDIDTNKYRTHGFLFSPNKVFLGVLCYPCRVNDLTRGRDFIHFYIFNNVCKDPFQVLMNIKENNIRDYWDCFETLRVKSLQEKEFPWKGIDPSLNYDELPLVKLKILRWIAKMSESQYEYIPRIENYDIKSYILIHYAVDIKLAVERMTNLLNIYFSDKTLSLFQMRSLDLLNFFLKEMVLKDILVKANLGKTFIGDIYGVMKIANELNYPTMPQCVWCGEKIIGASCVPPHADSRCAISLMPILISPGYKCPFCKCIVHRELGREFNPIFCPYCDVPMKRKCFDKKTKKEEVEATHVDDVIQSDCKEDCINSDVNFADIEDNVIECCILSDSDDEEELNEFYEKIKRITLSTGRRRRRSGGEKQEDMEGIEEESVEPLDGQVNIEKNDESNDDFEDFEEN